MFYAQSTSAVISRATLRTDEGATLSADKNRTTKKRDPEDEAVTQTSGVFAKRVVVFNLWGTTADPSP